MKGLTLNLPLFLGFFIVGLLQNEWLIGQSSLPIVQAIPLIKHQNCQILDVGNFPNLGMDVFLFPSTTVYVGAHTGPAIIFQNGGYSLIGHQHGGPTGQVDCEFNISINGRNLNPKSTGSLTFVPNAMDIDSTLILEEYETGFGREHGQHTHDFTPFLYGTIPAQPIITIEQPEFLDYSSIQQICQNSAPIFLTNYFNGYATGNIPVQFYLDDAGLVPALTTPTVSPLHPTTSPITILTPFTLSAGNHTLIAYKHYDNGNYVDHFNFIVYAPAPITFGAYPKQVCTNQGNIIIPVSPSGGTWVSANNVIDIGGNFNPALATPGNLTLTYNYTDPSLATNPLGCTSTNTISLTVTSPPDPVIITGNTIGCNGTAINLSAKASNAVVYNWYHTPTDTAPFARGNTILYTINSTEKLYCVGVGTTGCGLSISNAGNVQITSLTPTLTANLTSKSIPFGGIAQYRTNSPYNITSYSWDFGDGEFSYEASPDHYYYQSGIFTTKLALTSPEGCTNSYILPPVNVGVEDSVSISPGNPRPTGIDSSAYHVNTFPSPFTDHIFLTITLPKNEIIQYRLIDLTGNLVLQGSFQGLIGNNRFTLSSLGNLPMKNYYLLVFQSKDLNQVVKILKK